MDLTTTDLKTLSETARNAARIAGKYIQSQFDQHYITERKEGGDSLASQVVTEVDLNAQRIILEQLYASMKAYDLGILTEELPDDHSRFDKDYFWCIDPMDGTLPFTEHRTGYAVSIALISRFGDPVIGVVYVPDSRDGYSAIKGSGVFLNGKPFVRNTLEKEIIHFYMDRSFQSESYFDLVKSHFEANYEVQYHADYGGVRNALGVVSSTRGCYFKFPKPQKGCGSIWDYAATRLFFEELDLPVTNAQGHQLHLNNSKTTFMNESGILYATDTELQKFILDIGTRVADQ
ncbi:MAG: inositol monophosphatase family protein [Marinoscillum sp.]